MRYKLFCSTGKHLGSIETPTHAPFILPTSRGKPSVKFRPDTAIVNGTIEPVFYVSEWGRDQVLKGTFLQLMFVGARE